MSKRENSDDKSDRMSSVSQCSNFSIKLQQYIAKQDGQMAAMRKAMVAAGLDPDMVIANDGGMEVDEVDVSTKKRLPSGSPEGKNWDASGSTDSSVEEGEENENDDDGLSDSQRSKEYWKLQKRGGKKSRMPTKREQKRLRRLEKAKADKTESDKLKTKVQAQTRAQAVDDKVHDAQAQAKVQSQIPVAGAADAAAATASAVGHAEVSQVESEKSKSKLPPETVSQVTIPVTAPNTAPNAPNATLMPVVSDTQSVLYSQVLSTPNLSSPPKLANQNDSSIAPTIPPVFKTPGPDGPYRDEITVEIHGINGREFKGTITPAEARKTIFQDVLGFSQDDLASVTIGFNRGRTVTFKLKQQFDIDDLFEWEHFEFERSIGQDVSLISCKIRGVRDPSKRADQPTKHPRSAQFSNQPHIDDGTRLVRVIGCDYRLLESEILDWLSLFGEVLSEIREEKFEDVDDPNLTDLPPVGNGTYLVKMKLKKDLPNWVPMYGRKICLDYRGIKKQCSACFGPHTKKFCKYERMSLDEYARRFRIQNPDVPEQYYGRLAKIENIAQQVQIEPKSTGTSVDNIVPSSTTTLKNTAPPTASELTVSRAPLKLSLRRDSNSGAGWIQAKPNAEPGLLSATTTKNVTETALNFLSGIRASFRPTTNVTLPLQSSVQPNVVVTPVNPTVRIQSSRAGRGRGLNSKPNE